MKIWKSTSSTKKYKHSYIDRNTHRNPISTPSPTNWHTPSTTCLSPNYKHTPKTGLNKWKRKMSSAQSRAALPLPPPILSTALNILSTLSMMLMEPESSCWESQSSWDPLYPEDLTAIIICVSPTFWASYAMDLTIPSALSFTTTKRSNNRHWYLLSYPVKAIKSHGQAEGQVQVWSGLARNPVHEGKVVGPAGEEYVLYILPLTPARYWPFQRRVVLTPRKPPSDQQWSQLPAERVGTQNTQRFYQDFQSLRNEGNRVK